MYPCAAFGFGHGRNQWRSCILRVLAWPRNKKSRGEWDETQNLEVCLLLALLLTACGKTNAGSGSSGSMSGSSTSSAQTQTAAWKTGLGVVTEANDQDLSLIHI